MDFIYVVTVIVAALLLIFALYIFLICPQVKKKEMDEYRDMRFAHRGLHGEGVSENSMTAFRLAVENGYGIELDVRLSKDGELVVFHDSTLNRMTGVDARVNEKTLAELSEIKLIGSGAGDTVPALCDVLKLVDGKIPLLVEIKEEEGSTAVAEKTAEVLSSYNGRFIIESFNPNALRVIKKRMPSVLRGILSAEFHKKPERRSLKYFSLSYMLINFICRPNFIAYHYVGYRNLSLKICRALGAMTVAWTTRSKAAEKEALDHGFDVLIFELERKDGANEKIVD